MVARLGDHGCENMTQLLDYSSFSTQPISSGGFGDVYRGMLTEGVQVAIKTMRVHVHSEEDHKPLKVASLSAPCSLKPDIRIERRSRLTYVVEMSAPERAQASRAGRVPRSDRDGLAVDEEWKSAGVPRSTP